MSLESLALLLTRPYISCSEAPTGLRSVRAPGGLLCREVTLVMERSGDAGLEAGDVD